MTHQVRQRCFPSVLIALHFTVHGARGRTMWPKSGRCSGSLNAGDRHNFPNFCRRRLKVEGEVRVKFTRVFGGKAGRAKLSRSCQWQCAVMLLIPSASHPESSYRTGEGRREAANSCWRERVLTCDYTIFRGNLKLLEYYIYANLSFRIWRMCWWYLSC